MKSSVGKISQPILTKPRNKRSLKKIMAKMKNLEKWKVIFVSINKQPTNKRKNLILIKNLRI